MARVSVNPCSANRLISDRMRRCVSIANESSSRIAASRLMICELIGRFISALQQEVDQHRQHREQEGGAEEFRGAENAHLGAQRLDQGHGEAAHG